MDATSNTAPPFFDVSLAATPTTSTTCQKHLTADLTKYVLNSSSTKLHPSTSPSTISHHRRNASWSIRLRGTNSFAAGEMISPSCTKLVGPGSSVLLGDTNGTYITTGFTSVDIDLRPFRSTARPSPIPPDVRQDRPPRTIAIPERNIPRFQVQPRPTQSLA